MKKIILLTLTLLFSLVGYSQFPTPGTEGFEGTTGADLPTPTTPSAWTLGTGVTGNQWAVFDNGVGLTKRWAITTTAANVYAGTNSAFMDRENIGIGNTCEDYLATPKIVLPSNGQLRFWTRSTLNPANGTDYIIKVFNFTQAGNTGSQTNPANYTQIAAQYTEATLSAVYNVYEEKVIDLTPYGAPGDEIYIAFEMRFTQPTASLGGDRWLVDDIKIVQNCLNPTNPVVTNITQTSASLNWGNPSGSTSWEIEVVLSTATPTGTGTVYNGTLPYNVNGLLPNTSYNYYVRSLCSSTNSAWVGPTLFTTSSPGLTCGSPIVIGSLPYSTTDNTSNYGDTTDVSQPAACAGTATNYMTGNDVFYSYTPTTTGTISITMTPNANWSGIFVYQGCANVGVTCVAGVANTGGTIRSIPSLSVTAGLPYIIVISTNATPQTVGYSLLIQQVNCPPPTNLTATNIGQTSANLSWANPGGATSWQVAVQSAGSAIPSGAGTTVNTNTNYSPTGLTAATSYQYYVRADCGNGTFSAWSGPFPFTTSVCDVAQQCNYTFRLTDSFGDGWNGNTMSVRQNGVEVALLGPSFTTGAGPINIVVPMCNTLPFELYWNTGGTFATEVGVSIINSFNQTIFVKPSGTGTQNSSLYTSTVDCTTPACLAPTNLTATSISQTSATLGWTNGGGETSWQVIVLPGGSPAPAANNPSWTNAPTNPFTVNGLTSGTSYDFYVRPVCSLTSTGPSSTVKNFNTTICAPSNQCNYSFTMTDSFGDGWNGNTMSIIQNGITVATIGSTFTTGNGPIVVQVPLCHGIPFSLQWNTGGNFANEVGVSIKESLAPQATIFTKPPGTGAQGTTLYSGNAECFLPTCPKPINLVASNVTQTSATLSWTEQGTATSWQIYIVPFGSLPPTPGTLGILTTTPSYVMTNLPPGTAYTFYVRAVCSTSDLSLWSQPATFGTLPGNDECSNATFAIVNQNLNCVQTTPGTLVGATQSLPNVNCPPGVANDDVWYTFTATAATHIISFNNVVPAGTGLNYAIFQGTGCGALTQVGCNSGAGLTPGVTYYLRVYSTSAAPQFANFSLCIGTLPCSEAPAFCTGQTVTYANSTNVPSLGQIGCLFDTKNPAFFFLQVNQAGPLSYLISQVNTAGAPRDVDYVAWGPFSDLSSACSGVPQNPLPGATPIPTPASGCPGTIHACSFSIAPQEIMCIPNAQLCEVYVIMITNYSNDAGTVTFTQTNSGGGTTACFPINTFNYPLTTYCQDGADPTPVLAPNASAGTYTSTPGLVINSATGTVDLSASTPGAYVVTSSTATTIGGTCNSIPFITTTRTIIITAPASATISYAQPSYCNSINTVQTITRAGTTGGTFSASPAGLSLDPNTGNMVPSASIPGTYTVSYNVAATGGCPLFTTPTTVTIVQSTYANTGFTYPTPVCVGGMSGPTATPTYSGGFTFSTGTGTSQVNGVFTATPSGAVIDPSTGVIDLILSLPGTYTVTYSIGDNLSVCAIGGSSTAQITIKPIVNPVFTQISSICQNTVAPSLPLTDNTGITGTWSPSSIDTTTLGTTTYFFTPDNPTQCSTSASMDILITTPITPTFNAIANICKDLTAPALPNPSTNGISGSWSPITIDTSVPGTYSFTFTPNAGQCAANGNLSVTIDAPSIVPTFNPIANICQDLTAPALPNPSINGITGSWSPATINTSVPGTYTFTFTPDPAQCAVNTSVTVTIDAPSIVPTFNAIANICQNGPAPTLSGTSNNGINGTWSPATINTTVVGTTIITFTPASAQCAVSTTLSVTVVAPTQATFTQIQPICQGNTAPNLPTTSLTGITGSWSPTAISTTNTGTTVYTFTPTIGLCATGTTMNITINPQPVVPAQSAVDACNNYTLPSLTVGNYYTGQNGTGTQVPVGTVISTTTTLYVYAQSGTTPNCTDQETLNITITPSPNFTITGGCQGLVYELKVVPGGNYNPNVASYSWLNPSGVVISGANSDTLIVPTNLAGSYTCIVSVPNGTGTCSDSEVFIANDVTCAIPKGISPNNDGKNDSFDLTGFNVKVLNIYNRYGTIVYSKTNYKDEWFGQSDKGNELPDGTYYYIIERDGQESRSGWVYINRENK
jgi:gliding motility-associated-like protein